MNLRKLASIILIKLGGIFMLILGLGIAFSSIFSLITLPETLPPIYLGFLAALGIAAVIGGFLVAIIGTIMLILGGTS